MVVFRLTDRQLDALREIGYVGMGHAATALSQLTGKTFHLEVPRVRFTDTVSMAGFLGNAEVLTVGIHLRMLGDAQGHILMVFPQENALSILADILPRKLSGDGSFTDLELSALKEVGNILASAYLNALGAFLKMTLIPSVPILAVGSTAKIAGSALSEFGVGGGMALMLDTEFFSRDERISSQISLLPAPSSLNVILNALGIEGVQEPVIR
jgi:chemotaxis protein CheC